MREAYAMLRLMRCRDRSIPAPRRREDTGVTLDDHHRVDRFEVRCPGEPPRLVYMDLFHCGPAR